MREYLKKDVSMTTDYFGTDNLKKGLKTRALRGATVSVISQLLMFVIQTGGTILLARLLMPGDFGLVTMVLSISLLLQNFGVNGFTEAIIQKDIINHGQISTLFWINAGISLLLALLFVGSAPVIVWFYKEPRLYGITVAIASSILFAGLSTQHLALLKRNMQFNKISINNVIGTTISSIAPIFLAWWGWGYWALVAKWVLAPLMITIGAWILCDWRPGLPARRTGVRPMLRFAFHAYGNFVMSYLRRNIDKILIGRTFGSQPLGYYDRAYHLSNMLPIQIITPLYSVAVSTFSKITDEPEKYRSNYLKVLSLFAFIGMPLSAALTLISRDVIILVLGPQWYEAGGIFLAFSLSIGITIIYITHGWLHLSLGTPDRWFRWSVVEFAVTMICFFIGLPFGALGIAFAFSASFYILLLPALWYAGKPVELKITSVLSSIWRYYVSALAAGVFCWLILHSYGLTAIIYKDMNSLSRIATAILLCTSVYLLLIIATFGSTKPIRQFVSVLQEIVQKRSAAKGLT